ncbi:glycosyltransferase [Flavobacterium sp. W20_MBD1_R3]|uniref:glycosyltransferase n=1 Tax=Flavobacterium sp. W20_MBD1_R3 TaxID=3240278 RepID=UPI003F90C1BF
MELQRNNIAMVSPSHNAYSETFIQEQKNGLQGNVFYYYGGSLPTHLEHHGKLMSRSIRLCNKLQRKLGLASFNAEETAFIHSLQQHKIQVVLAQYGTTAHRIVKICRHLHLPLITHFHGYDASIQTVIDNCNNYSDVFAYSTSVIAVSVAMQEKLIRLGCPKEKVVYNPCGPHPSFIEVQPAFSTPTFIGLGRFVDKKAPYYTILAFSQVLKQYPNAQLLIGGKGELYEVCHNLIRYLKVEDRVSLPGILTQEQFKGYLSTSLAFVQHSITALSGDQEGTPVAVLEASAAGLPVIATIHAGIPDVIIDGDTGFLVSEHDVEAMAEKMMLLLGNSALAMQLGSNGKERIQSNFTMEKHLQVIDALLLV